MKTGILRTLIFVLLNIKKYYAAQLFSTLIRNLSTKSAYENDF